MKTRRSPATFPAAAAIAGAAVATLAVGGVTAVEAATTPKPVKACADSKQALRLSVKGKCPKGTHAVTIAARGPQGLPGTPGATGSTGTTGATGPSTTYLGRGGTVYLPAETGQADAHKIKPVATLTLPAGSYLVGTTVTAKISNGNHINERVVCVAQPVDTATGGTVQGSTLSDLAPTTFFFGGYGHIEWSSALTYTVPTTVILECEAFGNDATTTANYTTIDSAQLRATTVGQVVDQTAP